MCHAVWSNIIDIALPEYDRFLQVRYEYCGQSVCIEPALNLAK